MSDAAILSGDDRAELETRLAACAARAEAALDALLPPPDVLGPEMPVAAAMRHAALGGGKRLRAYLVMETAALLGAPPERADRVAAAVECLHAYSLVHDDMPCMDDDTLRRGRPTVHVEWDDATAVLAGDALQTFAFELLSDPATHPSGAVRAGLCLALARASGVAGMVGGQALDIAAEGAGAPLGLAAVERLQGLKTGALIVFAAEAGAIVAEAEAARAPIRAFAAAMGAAFQIQDDVIDARGDAAAAGKAVGKDAAAGKATFVSLLGLDGAARRAAALVEEAEAALAPLGPEARPLALAARFALARTR
ncbi:MAG: polyprenyl synthetase family protein [Paracoccaceae bacterium]